MLKRIVKRLLSFKSWKTDKKLIVFISDDWGSIRNTNKLSRQKLIELGFDMDSNYFDKYDSLETNEDLEQLFNILISHKDHLGNSPKITAVYNCANPDFDKIKEDGFREYYWKPTPKLLEEDPKRNRVVQYYNDGIKEEIFYPESHGREHLQYSWWLNELNVKDSKSRLAFDLNYFFIKSKDQESINQSDLGRAFDACHPQELEKHKETLFSALELFEHIFGYKPIYFTPPSLVFPSKLEKTLSDTSIKLLDVPLLRNKLLGNSILPYDINYLGKRSASGITYLVRNAVFEPSSNTRNYGVAQCLKMIDSAFKNKQPAIISNHRASFMGSIDEANRSKGLEELNELFNKIIKLWPDVEFLNVKDLYRLMCKELH